MPVLHFNWSAGALHLWAEDPARWTPPSTVDPAPSDSDNPPFHPFAAPAGEVVAAAADVLAGSVAAKAGVLRLRLPAAGGAPRPSTRLAHALGHGTHDNGSAGHPFAVVSVETIAIPPALVRVTLERAADWQESGADDGRGREAPVLAASAGFFIAAGRLVQHLLAQQRFVPMLRQGVAGALRGCWQPWLADEAAAVLASGLLRAMPPAVRAGVDEFDHEGWPILEDFLGTVLDAECRRIAHAEELGEGVRERDPADPHVAWLRGLLLDHDAVPAESERRAEMARGVRRWVGVLEERGAGAAWRLCLRLGQPEGSEKIPDLTAPPESVVWPLTLHLRAADSAGVEVDAADVWLLSTDSLTVLGRRLDEPRELLLRELARAARLYAPLERAMSEAEPSALSLTTAQAYQFLREHTPVLREQGIEVDAPPWWDSPTVRLGARLHLESEPAVTGGSGAWTAGAQGARLGLSSLVNYKWEITIGGATLTLREFELLAQRRSPLLRVGGKWVEVRPEDVRAAAEFVKANPGGNIEVGEALRLAFGAEGDRVSIPVVGVEASGWVRSVFLDGAESIPMLPVEQPHGFTGTLRPYQLRGVSWLTFLERFGLGACLADDMGLGKTIQLLALLAHEREVARESHEANIQPREEAGNGSPGSATGDSALNLQPSSFSTVPPTLLVVPMSVLGNWQHEARRFCPGLRVLVHHGPERGTGDAFADAALRSDAVITTYALAHRDRELLERIPWRRIVLDEAQYIKNPQAKQAQAVRAIPAERRIALTGTPLENRLTELWSILDFLNPGYLGTAAGFRRRFAIPIERSNDHDKRARLRALVQPFILRRLKTDPAVVSDLPEKVETKEFCHLTSEQASLYEANVQRMLGEVDRAEGIHRRGLVLAALIRLKQVCNHPSQVLRDFDPQGTAPPDPSRSGKCERLLEMLDEVLASGEQAIVFTQFRQMGAILAPMIRHELDREALFLHGGVPQKQRDQIVAAFQRADGASPVLVASLKAGGVGLNLTAATHVFHFDRWWNPAVENQATDRAFRIGQTRRVQVHKFVVAGTLEERIDEMLEQKTELAEMIIGGGERALTELDTSRLRELLSLRAQAIGDE